jgi:hypothetical protein
LFTTKEYIIFYRDGNNVIIPPLPEGEGGILFYLCPSFTNLVTTKEYIFSEVKQYTPLPLPGAGV